MTTKLNKRTKTKPRTSAVVLTCFLWIRQKNWIGQFLTPGVCNSWPSGKKWPGSGSLVARGKAQILKQAFRFLSGQRVV